MIVHTTWGGFIKEEIWGRNHGSNRRQDLNQRSWTGQHATVGAGVLQRAEAKFVQGSSKMQKVQLGMENHAQDRAWNLTSLLMFTNLGTEVSVSGVTNMPMLILRLATFVINSLSLVFNLYLYVWVSQITTACESGLIQLVLFCWVHKFLIIIFLPLWCRKPTKIFIYRCLKAKRDILYINHPYPKVHLQYEKKKVLCICNDHGTVLVWCIPWHWYPGAVNSGLWSYQPISRSLCRSGENSTAARSGSQQPYWFSASHIPWVWPSP
jgi:hypothetical protein